MADIVSLPTEIVLGILLSLPGRSVLSLCTTNRQLQELCADPYLWSRLLRRDYPDLVVGKYPQEEYVAAIEIHDHLVEHTLSPTGKIREPRHSMGLANPNHYPIEIIYDDDEYSYAPAIRVEHEYQYSYRCNGEAFSLYTVEKQIVPLLAQGYRLWYGLLGPAIPEELALKWIALGVARLVPAKPSGPSTLVGPVLTGPPI